MKTISSYLNQSARVLSYDSFDLIVDSTVPVPGFFMFFWQVNSITEVHLLFPFGSLSF